jgi:hypothetical protein
MHASIRRRCVIKAERVVRVCSKVRPEGLVGNTTMDLFVIDDSEKPHNPSQWIIGLTGGKC